jgi:Holliday junction resolvase RusA-like endonuclease
MRSAWLSRIDSEVADYLGANELWRRSLRLGFTTAALLRKSDNRRQHARQEALVAEVRAQARAQMREQRRRAFRGDVSVEMTMYAPTVQSPPAAPTSVKAYLDALNGIVWADDRQVSHLTVDRVAADHPWQRRAREGRESQAALGTEERQPWVSLVVLPARVYTEHYDRMWRLRDDIVSGRYDHDLDLDDAGDFWDYRWNVDDDERLDELRSERRDELAGRGIYGVAPDEIIESLRAMREREIEELELKLLLHERPGFGDRPGPPPALADPEVQERVGLAPIDLLEKVDTPSAFRVQLPREGTGDGQPSWRSQVRDAMTAHRERWWMFPEVLEEPLALDIAARGMGENGKDIDNLAHTVLAAFEDLFCARMRGTVTAYRAYRTSGGEPGVRVVVMSERRLRQLEAAMDAARDYLMRRGPRRDD